MLIFTEFIRAHLMLLFIVDIQFVLYLKKLNYDNLKLQKQGDWP